MMFRSLKFVIKLMEQNLKQIKINLKMLLKPSFENMRKLEEKKVLLS